MNWNGLKPPTLCPVAQCNASLNFFPSSYWPEKLPAVAIHGYIIAGFGQKLVFNHELDLHKSEAIVDLFHSLYPKLSQLELNRLWLATQRLSWFPILQIADRYGLVVDLFIDDVTVPTLATASLALLH